MHDSPRPAKRKRLSPSADHAGLDSTDDELLSQTSIFTPSKHPKTTAAVDRILWPSIRAEVAADDDGDDDLLLPTPKYSASLPQSNLTGSVVKLPDHARDGTSMVRYSGELSTLTKIIGQERTTSKDYAQAELVAAQDARLVQKRTSIIQSTPPQSAPQSVDLSKDVCEAQPSRSSKRQRRTPKKYLEDLEALKNMTSKSHGSGKQTRSARRRNEQGSLRAAGSPPDPRRTVTSPLLDVNQPMAQNTTTVISGAPVETVARDVVEQPDTVPSNISTPSRSSKRNKASISSILQKIEESPSARLSSARLLPVVESPSKMRPTTDFIAKLLVSESDDVNDDEDICNDEELALGHENAVKSASNTGLPVSSLGTTTQDPKGTSVPTVIELEEAVQAHPEAFRQLKSIIMEQITGQRDLSSLDQDEERAKVYTLLEQTVAAGESNSMLIVGARGSGKSALLQSVLNDLVRKYEDTFYIIRLNGFIHTDDKLALREMWRQIGQEMEVEEDGSTKNYADTLSTLLALLSHLPEASDGLAAPVVKSVVFVIDEFDLFAAHPRQTLLYNLFDIAQSRKAPIAVLGLTTRVDVVESLEKRVKSRFSHRSIHLSLPKSIASFRNICKAKIRIDAADVATVAAADSDLPRQLVRRSGSTSTLIVRDLVQAWNVSIENLLDIPTIAHHIYVIYHTSKSVSAALLPFLLPIANLTVAEPTLKACNLFLPINNLAPPDSKLSLLSSLPSLALALLIAAARLDVILGVDTCNFAMAYDEYATLAARARVAAASTTLGLGIGGKVWSREVAKAAWEQLVETDLLLSGGGGMGSGAEHMVRCDVALEEIEGAVPDMERGLVKWCREI